VNDMTEQAVGAAAGEGFLGLPFTRLDMTQTIGAIERASRSGEWRYVVTPNASHLARLRRAGPALAAIYRNAAFCVLDSRVVALVATLTGLRPPPVIPGSDLVDLLFQRAIKPATPICVIGGSDLIIERLRARFGLHVVHHAIPSFGFLHDEAEIARTVAFIVASRADYTFLIVGSPQQEILAARVAAAGGARGVGVCAGASIEFIAGTQKRAPRFLQHLALEWAHRLYMEPRRLAWRYLVESPRGLLVVLRYAARHHRESMSIRGCPATDGPKTGKPVGYNDD
jgi:N-acetylglucosaminyldiphosphoundecaprenol N-acetyl-beta-D-mannosaminyltransferase